MSLTLILGPMFSAKSETLLAFVKKYTIAGKKCLVVKHKIDTRYTDNENILITHAGTKYNGCITASSIKDVNNIVKRNKYDVIAIDEGNFYDDIAKAAKWADNGIKVIISALSGTFDRKLFGKIHELIPHANNITLLSSVCELCKDENNAIYTYRTSDDKATLVVGGKDKYIPLCRKCYLEKTNL